MISIEIQELAKDKGFIVDYYDTDQPSDLDEQHVFFETYTEAQIYLINKVAETLRLRKGAKKT